MPIYDINKKDLSAEDRYIQDTHDHISKVRTLLRNTINDLSDKAEYHDASKLGDDEFSIYVKYTPKLAECTYGSPEYKQNLKEMKPALDHHYAENDHHPEHFANGIKDMTLVNILEMLCDWKAASMRHPDSNFIESIEKNQERFGYSDDVKQILINTANYYFK